MNSSSGPAHKRQRKSKHLVQGSVEATQAVTHLSNVFSGPRNQRRVLVPLVTTVMEDGMSNDPTNPKEHEATQGIYNDSGVFSDHFEIPRKKKSKTQQEYMREWVDRVEDLLQASLIRETWPPENQHCRACSTHSWAIWRCIDCTLGEPICRKCMRHSHQVAPFHRIECWAETHFRRAELWEVSCYIFVPHRLDDHGCGMGVEESANEDVDVSYQHANDTQSTQPSAPVADGLNNTYVQILHTNGIHHMAMVTCYCRGEHSVLMDLVACQLLPASFTKIRTLFSVQLMDHFRLCNLELKASAYQFYQLIRRMTTPIGWTKIVSVYHEFRCMSQLWRWLKKLRWAGYGHKAEDPKDPPYATLSLYCPTCPQPGINLPTNWKDDPNRTVYKHIFVADRNFKADHVRQKCNDDIWLIDRAGMALNSNDYQQFLASAIERLMKAPCENTFKAITNALLATEACDRTGKVAFACAQHGEQQKNIDYALLQAIKSTHVEPEQGLLLIYDIVCAWIVHVFDRIGHLLPAGLIIDKAIDLFHVHGHKDICFFRFASTFIPGAAIVAGQILESLWLNLNAISTLVRTASLAHQEEVLDNHATDSNYKKMLGMTKVLSTKYMDAIVMVGQTDAYFLEMSGDIAQATLNEWEDKIQSVEAMRLADIQRMDIYSAHVPDTMTDNTADIVGTEDGTNNAVRAWLRFALLIEEKQIDVQNKVHRLGSVPREQDQQVVKQLREVLTSMIAELKSQQQMSEVADVMGRMHHMQFGNETEFDDIGEEDPNVQGGPAVQQDANDDPESVHGQQVPTILFVEHQILLLPSNFNVPEQYAPLELELRKQQARNQITRIHDVVADISFLY
ncbi:hypothetical protein CVT25_008016 [Psilocybe cyanescens]|uniref:CxC2-like cysteine cluster KDZ transposase-associated domain-containing protein n=1 Tax=Psilocybe cyanescens TaxID=93625 RepID=A0A409XTU2_PSICY|nr:hypothetical protein CVT25_008016 [Psilocybe cyanescens]